MPKRSQPSQQYKTEEQIKADAKARMEEEKRLEAMKKPRSQAEKKVENFFYHYKYALIAAVFGVIVLSVFVHDMVTKENPDLTLIVVTSRYLGDSDQQALGGVLEPYTLDLNQDGQNQIQINYIQLTINMDAMSGEGNSSEEESAKVQVVTNAEMEYAEAIKLTAVFAAGDDPLLLMDENAYRYITQTDSEVEAKPVFRLLEGVVTGAEGDRLPIENSILAKESGLEGLSFYLRDWEEGSKQETTSLQVLEMLQNIAR